MIATSETILAEAVTAEAPIPWNCNLNRMKAAHLPHAMAYPQRYVLLRPSTASERLALPALRAGGDGDVRHTIVLDIGAYRRHTL